MIDEADHVNNIGLSLADMTADEFLRRLAGVCDDDPLTAFIVLARVHGLSYAQIASSIRRIGRTKLSKQMVHHRICGLSNQQLSDLLKQIKPSKHSQNYFKESLVKHDEPDQLEFKF